MSRHAMTGLICTEEVLRPFLSLAYPPTRARSFRFSRDGRRFVHEQPIELDLPQDRKSTRLNSSHGYISYAVFCLKKKKLLFPYHLASNDSTTVATPAC